MSPRNTARPAPFPVGNALVRLGLIMACVLTVDALLTLLTGSPMFLDNALWRHGFGNQLAQSLSILAISAAGIALAGAMLGSARVLRAARVWCVLLALLVVAVGVTHVVDISELVNYLPAEQHARLRGIDAKVIVQMLLGVGVLGVVALTAGKWSALLRRG